MRSRSAPWRGPMIWRSIRLESGGLLVELVFVYGVVAVRVPAVVHAGVRHGPVELVLVQLIVGGVGDALKAVEPMGHVVEVVQDGGSEEPVSRVRLISPDADEALPAVMEALDGVEVRSVDLPTPSFDEVFFRLVKGVAERSGIETALRHAAMNL